MDGMTPNEAMVLVVHLNNSFIETPYANSDSEYCEKLTFIAQIIGEMEQRIRELEIGEDTTETYYWADPELEDVIGFDTQGFGDY